MTRTTWQRICGTAIAAASLSLVLAASQAGPQSSRTGAVPRAAGVVATGAHPDLQAVWNFSSLTPLERPAEFSGKPTMSLAEAAQFEKTVTDRNNADRRDGGVAADLARAYNDAWYDRGTHVAIVNGVARTSLVVDPADGRIPALTADAQRRADQRAQQRREHQSMARRIARWLSVVWASTQGRRCCPARTTTTCSCSSSRTT